MSVKDDMLSSLQQKVVELEVKVKTWVKQQIYFFQGCQLWTNLRIVRQVEISWKESLWSWKTNMDEVFCKQCDSEFPSESEQIIHSRNDHAFECNMCKIRLKNKEVLYMQFLTCKIDTCSKCEYKNKRLSEMFFSFHV